MDAGGAYGVDVELGDVGEGLGESWYVLQCHQTVR